MVRRKGPQADEEAEGCRKIAVTASNDKPREGQGKVAGNKEGQWGEEPPEWMKRAVARGFRSRAKNPLHGELLRQKVRLKENGAAMTWSQANGVAEILRGIQEDTPTEFATLVALAKPRGATKLSGKVSGGSLTALREAYPSLFEEDSTTVEPLAALVLDAAYVEADGGAVLRDPVAYSPEFVEKWRRIEEELRSEEDRILRIARKEARRERRGKGDGPSL